MRYRFVRSFAQSALTRVLAACLLLALACASAFAAEQARLTVLPNGLRVLTQEVHAAPVVSVYAWYRAGSRNESTGITGISHFVEHMMFKGSRHFAPGEATRLVTRTGGWDNGFTWLDYTAYVETLPASQLDLALRVEADRMARAAFLPAAVTSEKTVVLSELEGNENDPGFYLGTAVSAVAFMAHPYHSPVIGWKSDVMAFDRTKAVDYYRAHYQPNNATLVIVGDFDTESALGRVRELFGAIPAGPTPASAVTIEPPQQGERRVEIRRPGATGMIEMAFHVPAAMHPDHFALDVVESVLGSGRTSRLYRALVEKNIAVDAQAYNATNRDPTLFEVYITLAEGVGHAQAEAAALAEIDRLASELISERELQRAQNLAKASFIYGADSMSSLGYRLGYFDVTANFRLLYDYVSRIEKVTPAQVREVVQRYLTADNRTLGWFIPTGGAPAGPTAPPGPVSAYGRTAAPGNVILSEALRGSEARSRRILPSTQRLPRPVAGSAAASRPTLTASPAMSESPDCALGTPLPSGETIEEPVTGRAELTRTRPAFAKTSVARPLSPRDSQDTVTAALPGDAPAPAPGAGSRPVRFALDNGAVFIVYANPVVPAVAIRGMVGAGAIFDPPDKPGLAGFTADMLSRGAGARSAQEIAEALEFVAAEVGVGSGIQVGNISGRCLKDDLPLVMEILADEVRRPSFPPDEVALVRSQLEVALREALQDTGEVADREFYATLYPQGHPLHYRPLGTLESLARITRDDLMDFHRCYYRPDTLVLVIVGDVSADQMRALANQHFGDWRTEASPELARSDQRPAVVIPDVPAPPAVVRKSIPVPGKTQSDIIIGLPGISRLAPDYYSAELMNYVLGGGGLSSRLAERIRDEQGLAYSVYSYFAAYRGAGPWTLRMGVNPARVERAIDSALAELRRIREHPPTDAELRLWKDYVTGSAALRLETNGGIAASLADAEFYGLGLDYPWRYAEFVNRVTPAEAAVAAEKYMQPDHAIIITAGPSAPTSPQ